MTQPRALPSMAAPKGPAWRNQDHPRRIDQPVAPMTTARASRPIRVASRASLEPIGTKGAPSETLVASASGAASASQSSPSAVPQMPTVRHEPVGRSAEVHQMAPASTMPARALSQKIARQSETSRMAAPRTGPSTDPSSWTAPTTPSGKPRVSAGHLAATIARVAGTSPPPPTPCTTRPATRTVRSEASAVTADPTTKMARQPRRTRCLSSRSASRPIRGSTATYPSRKPLIIGVARCSDSMPMPTPCIISVSASTTT